MSDLYNGALCIAAYLLLCLTVHVKIFCRNAVLFCNSMLECEREVARNDKHLTHKSNICQVHLFNDLTIKVDSFLANNKQLNFQN